MIEESVFIVEFAKVVNQKSALTLDTELEQLDDYDSLTQMSIAAWISDHLDKPTSVRDLADMQKVGEVFNHINS